MPTGRHLTFAVMTQPLPNVDRFDHFTYFMYLAVSLSEQCLFESTTAPLACKHDLLAII